MPTCLFSASSRQQVAQFLVETRMDYGVSGGNKFARFDLTGGLGAVKESDGTVRVQLDLVFYGIVFPIDQNPSNPGRADVEHVASDCGFLNQGLDQAGKLLGQVDQVRLGAAAP